MFSKRAFINKLLKAKIFEESEEKQSVPNSKILVTTKSSHTNTIGKTNRKKNSLNLSDQEEAKLAATSQNAGLISSESSNNTAHSVNTFGWNTFSGFVTNLFHHKDTYQVNYCKKSSKTIGFETNKQQPVENSEETIEIVKSLSLDEVKDVGVFDLPKINPGLLLLDDLEYCDDNGEKFDEIVEFEECNQQTNLDRFNQISFSKKNDEINLKVNNKNSQEEKLINSKMSSSDDAKQPNSNRNKLSTFFTLRSPKQLFKSQQHNKSISPSASQLPPKYKPPPPKQCESIINQQPTETVYQETLPQLFIEVWIFF